MMDVLERISRNAGVVADLSSVRNWSAISSLAGPAFRGFLLQRGKQGGQTEVAVEGTAVFNWNYGHDRKELEKLYRAGVAAQWDAETGLEWETPVDPHNPERELFLDEASPLRELAHYRTLGKREQEKQRQALLSWLLSQFLHGEQGALFAACQVTQAVSWFDGKLYGSTQVIDEGRHCEVFHRYLADKLQKSYPINDNLYVILDALMTDRRWDIKFLGMQILVEGLALGAFGTLRESTKEPLLRDLLTKVMLDEGRHVHFGVVALKDFYTNDLSAKEREEREDWTYEVAVLLRNRFLAHEFYDEYYGHLMSRKAWDTFILESKYMEVFRTRMFRRLVPNLKKIGLLTDRVRPHYERLGLLVYENDKSAVELTEKDLLAG
jgi:hypothetical protein